MKIGNKIIALLLATATAAFGFTGCGAQSTGGQESAAPDNSGEALKIVTTVFPEYDWVKEILGDKADKAELTLLLDNGVDLHSYQPTAEDIAKISECDLFIYVGGESDGWVEDALAEVKDRDIRVVNLMETLGDSVKEEEVVEGMEAEEEEESEEAEEEEGPEYDEHVWLSLKNAQILVNKIAEEMGAADAENADAYKANAKAYGEKLAGLDSEYKSAVDAAPVKTLLFGDRFPFRYMVDDYGLDYYAAFVGCSAETEASFETVVFLAGKVDELGLGSVLTIESSDGKIAKTIIDNTRSKDQQVLTLDSMQSTTSEDIEKGASYLAIMKSNLEVLKAALK
ncbi:MAG: metal ABC transporter substrate-binding protein [Clostridia bacterium]|nr:metal ABC transporter substrate-binding protein [Clostridia bacterium]